MDRYRISQQRYKELRDLCLHPGHEELIDEALDGIDAPGLESWIKKHVTTEKWKWKRLEASGVPCSGDTFRVYRSKFYHYLDSIVRKRGEKNRPEEGYDDS